MSMKEVSGSHVQEWLLSQEGSPDAIPDIGIVEHIASCETCRGALLLLMSRLLGASLEFEAISCEQCQNDLPEFIGIERMQGLRAAVQRFPAIWWNIWSCPECSEAYQSAIDFMESDDLAEDVFLLPHQAHVQPQKALVCSLEIDRSTIQNFYYATLQLQYAMGDPEDGLILSQRVGAFLVRMTLQQENNDWMGIIQIQPAVSGQVALTFGDEILRAILDPDGHATIPALPLHQLVKEEQDQPITLVIKALPEE